jgi:hypothetical protein
MITLPAYLYETITATTLLSNTASWIRRFEHCADLVIELRSFSGNYLSSCIYYYLTTTTITNLIK